MVGFLSVTILDAKAGARSGPPTLSKSQTVFSSWTVSPWLRFMTRVGPPKRLPLTRHSGNISSFSRSYQIFAAAGENGWIPFSYHKGAKGSQVEGSRRVTNRSRELNVPDEG